MSNLRGGGPWRPKPWHTFDVLGAKTATRLPCIPCDVTTRLTSQLPSLAPLRCARQLCTKFDSISHTEQGKFITCTIAPQYSDMILLWSCVAFSTKKLLFFKLSSRYRGHSAIVLSNTNFAAVEQQYYSRQLFGGVRLQTSASICLCCCTQNATVFYVLISTISLQGHMKS